MDCLISQALNRFNSFTVKTARDSASEGRRVPRKRNATLPEISDTVSRIRRMLQDAILAKGARRTIQRRLRGLQSEYATWIAVLRLLHTHTDAEIAKMFADKRQLNRIIAQVFEGRPTVEQLSAFERLCEKVADTMAGRTPERQDLPELTSKLIQFLTPRAVRAKRFSEKFERAFQLRKEAERDGRYIPVKELCQQLAPYEYKKNPESCIRSMQRGIRRVEAEHARCLEHGIASPFFDEHRNDG